MDFSFSPRLLKTRQEALIVCHGEKAAGEVIGIIVARSAAKVERKFYRGDK